MTTEVQDTATKTEEQTTERTRSGPVYRPNVDIVETQDELLILADMPGARRESIDIDFDDGVLAIQGRVEPRHREGARTLVAEYGIGDFYRTFRVSEQVDASRIHAAYTAGVLTVHLPKAEAAKPRKIGVRAAG